MISFDNLFSSFIALDLLCALCDFAVNYFFILTKLFVSSGEPVCQSFRRDETPYLLQVWDNIQVLKKEPEM
jgi:hypothetical protein